MKTNQIPEEIVRVQRLKKAEQRAWLRTCSDEQLEDFMDNCSGDRNYWLYANAELKKRLAQQEPQPHRVDWLQFWVALLALIFAAIAALPVIQGCLDEGDLCVYSVKLFIRNYVVPGLSTFRVLEL